MNPTIAQGISKQGQVYVGSVLMMAIRLRERTVQWGSREHVRSTGEDYREIHVLEKRARVPLSEQVEDNRRQGANKKEVGQGVVRRARGELTTGTDDAPYDRCCSRYLGSRTRETITIDSPRQSYTSKAVHRPW